MGLHPWLYKQEQQAENELKAQGRAAQRIRQEIQPLLAEAKRLTAEQKEKVAELLAAAKEIDAQVQAIKEQRERCWPRCVPPRRPR